MTVIRTKMASALISAVQQRVKSGKPIPMGTSTSRVVRRVLTNNSAGVGVKWDSSRAKIKKQKEYDPEITADSAEKVMA